jgi:hypothetical protein
MTQTALATAARAIVGRERFRLRPAPPELSAKAAMKIR